MIKIKIPVIDYLLVLIICGFVGVFIMSISFSLPTERIASNVYRSLDTLKRETDYFTVTEGIPGSRLDNYTDAIYLNEALVSGQNLGLLKCALSGFYTDTNIDSPTQNLTMLFEGVSTSISPRESRFWNGYEVVLKPLLEITDYAGVRNINIIFEILLVAQLCFLMIERGLKKYLIPVILSYIFLNPISLALCMTFAGFFYCTVIPCIIILSKNDWLKQNHRYLLFFEFIGIVTFFFNMNYIQLICFFFPLMFYYMMNGFPQEPLEAVKPVAVLFFSWFIGWAGMMVFKWGMYAITFNPGMFTDMMDWALNRTSTEAMGVEITRLDAVKANLRLASSNNFWNLLQIVFVLSCIWKCIKNRVSVDFVAGFLLLLISISFPIIRYLIFANHVTIHYWVMYRLCVIPVFCFDCLIVNLCKSGKKEHDH